MPLNKIDAPFCEVNAALSVILLRLFEMYINRFEMRSALVKGAIASKESDAGRNENEVRLFFKKRSVWFETELAFRDLAYIKTIKHFPKHKKIEYKVVR